jgi:hypothetical protein
VNYAKLLEMNSFFTLHSFLEVGKTQDLPSKFWQTLGDALRGILLYCSVVCAYRRLSLFCSHLCHELVHGRNERDGAWLTVGLDAPTCQRLFAESMSSFCCPTTKPRVQRMDFTQMSLHF